MLPIVPPIRDLSDDCISVPAATFFPRPSLALADAAEGAGTTKAVSPGFVEQFWTGGPKAWSRNELDGCHASCGI